MKLDQERKYTCKLCKRSFPTGRILGGHMRGHRVALSSVKQELDVQQSAVGDFQGYVLRENPKKSWKFSVFNNHNEDVVSPVQDKAVKCEVCGKEFESRYCLNGHLRHHSRKGRKRVQCGVCGKRYKSARSLSGHTRWHCEKNLVCVKSRASLRLSNPVTITLSDAETVNLVRKKRSKRMRYMFTPGTDLSSFNESVSGFGFEQIEEEVAESLIMLSRGVGKRCWSNFSSNSLESSFVSYVEESSSEGGDGVSDGHELVKMQKTREEWLDSCAVGSQRAVHECDPIACDKGKNVSLEVQVDGISEFALGVSGKEMGFHCEINQEVGVDLLDLGNVNSIFSSKVEFDPYEVELEKDFGSKMENASQASHVEDDSSENFKFACKICSRRFPSHQKLGGHQTSHRMKQGFVSMKAEEYQYGMQTNFALEIEDAKRSVQLECVQDSAEQEIGEAAARGCKPQTIKEHKCSVCCKSFVSGQALGGHKRAHFFKAKAEMEHEVSDICNVYDANLSDLLKTEADQDIQLKPWWAGRSCENEGIVGTITS